MLFTMFCGAGPRHHLPGRVLPRPRLRLDPAVGGPLLRAVAAESEHDGQLEAHPLAGADRRSRRDVLREMRQRPSRPGCRADSSSAARSAPASACGCSRSPAARSGSCGRTSRAASAARSRSATWRPCHGNPAVQGVTLADGAPSYFPQARTYVQLIDPSARLRRRRRAPTATGDTTNVRTLYQRCPHLGCKPNFCTTNYWFECPCHGSRYDRLGTKVQRARAGAARPRPLRPHRRGRRAHRRHRASPSARCRSRSASPGSSRRVPRTGCI